MVLQEIILEDNMFNKKHRMFTIFIVYNNCEKIQLIATRIVSGLPIFASKESLYFETGWDPLSTCLLYTSPSPRDLSTSRMPSSA